MCVTHIDGKIQYLQVVNVKSEGPLAAAVEQSKAPEIIGQIVPSLNGFENVFYQGLSWYTHSG